MPTLKLCVRGLTGPRDETSLRDALLAETGVMGAVVSWCGNSAEVDFEDDAVSIDRLLEIVSAEGFTGNLSG